jgi:hypothetical protein
MKKRKLVLAIDFDGTIVFNDYPHIGLLKPNVKDVINDLYDNHNCEILIWTCRENIYLEEAKNFLIENNIKFHQINKNSDYVLNLWNDCDCRKIFADLYIDDKGVYSPIDLNWLDIKEKILAYKDKYSFHFL